MKNKITLIFLILLISLGIVLIPNIVHATDEPIVFTGENFAAYLEKVYDGFLKYFDKNGDHKFTQSELDEMDYFYIYEDAQNFRQEDFDNLKYFRNVEFLRLYSPNAIGIDVDLTMLTKLKDFNVYQVNRSNIPRFRVHDKLFLYTSAHYDWNFGYDETAATGNKIASIYIGGKNTFYAGEENALYDASRSSLSSAYLAESTNLIHSSNPTVATISIRNSENYEPYSIFALSVGTTTFTLHNIWGDELQWTVNVVESPLKNSPVLEDGRAGLRLFTDGRVLTEYGELYEVDYSNPTGPLKLVANQVNDYYGGDGNGFRMIHSGSYLRVEFDRVKSGYTYDTTHGRTYNYDVKYIRTDSILADNVKSIKCGCFITKNNDLYRVRSQNSSSEEYNSSDYYIEYVDSNVQSFAGNPWNLAYIKDGQLYYVLDYHSPYATGIMTDEITDIHNSWVQIGNKVYYFDTRYSGGTNIVSYTIAYSNFDCFIYDSIGQKKGYKLSDDDTEYTVIRANLPGGGSCSQDLAEVNNRNFYISNTLYGNR